MIPVIVYPMIPDLLTPSYYAVGQRLLCCSPPAIYTPLPVFSGSCIMVNRKVNACMMDYKKTSRGSSSGVTYVMSPWGKRASQFRFSCVTNAQLELNYYHIKYSKHRPGYNWLLGIKCHISWSKCQSLTHLVISFIHLCNAKPVLLLSGSAEIVVCASYYPLHPYGSSRGIGRMVNLYCYSRVGQHTHSLYLSVINTLCALNLLIKIYLSKTWRERNKSVYQSLLYASGLM